MNPKDRITSYLSAHRSKLPSSVDGVVEDIKFTVFYGMSPISDDEIRKVVVAWASIWAIGLIDPSLAGGDSAAPPPASQHVPVNSDFADAINKLLKIPHEIRFGKKAGDNITIDVSGATVNLVKPSGDKASLGVSWTGAVKFKAQSGPLNFEGNLSQDSWSMQVSLPRDSYVPDMSKFGQIFSKGESAMEQIVKSTGSFNNLSDIPKVAGMIKPHVSDVEKALSDIGDISKMPKPPLPGQSGMPSGVQAEAIFTVVW